MKYNDFFSAFGIEYYAVADINNITLTKSELLDREDFIPKSVILFLIPYYTLMQNFSTFALSAEFRSG